jgi:hypothetical protein
MPRNNIELYWQKAEKATEGVTAQVLVTDGNSSDYLLPFPCTLTAEGWVKTASGKPLAVRPTYWKLYVETPPKRKSAKPPPPPKGDRRTGFPDPGPNTGKQIGVS